jgi:drug/metabolite transporter (DMT)-like permease
MIRFIRDFHSQPVFMGYAFACGAALCYGTVTFLVRKVVIDVAPPLVAASFAMLFGTIFLSLINVRELPHVRRLMVKRNAVLLALAAGIFSTSGVVLCYLALSTTPVTVAAPVFALQPLIALVLSHLFLQKLEKVTPRILIGALLVVLGVILIAMSNT